MAYESRRSDCMSDVCLPDLSHRLPDRSVPGLHDDHARLGHTDRADLVDRHHAAVDVVADRIEHAARGPAGTQTDEFVLQHLDSLAHAAFDIVDIRFSHDTLLHIQQKGYL